MGQTLSYLIIYIVEAVIAWQYFSAIFLPKFRKRVNIPIIVFGYFIMFLISLKEVYWLNTIIFCILNLICIHFLFKTDLKTSLFHSLVLTIAMNVTELLIMNVSTLVFKDFNAYSKELSSFILLAVASKVLYYFVLQLIILLFSDRKEHSTESGIIVILLCTIPIVSLWITVTLIFICIEGNIPEKLNWFVSFGALFMLLLNVCVFFIYSLTQQESEKYLQAQLQLQKESSDAAYYKMLLVQDENQKILIHDIKKHLHTISDLLNCEHTEDAKEYLNNILESKELNEKLCFCDNPALNLILMRYREICQNKDIQLYVDIRKNTVSFIKIEDMGSLFGNLLENAVEAAAGSNAPYIELSVNYSDSNRLIISMVNSCNQEPIQTSSGDFISRKKDSKKHGLGMKSIRKIVQKYNGSLTSYYHASDSTFHTMITF